MNIGKSTTRTSQLLAVVFKILEVRDGHRPLQAL